MVKFALEKDYAISKDKSEHGTWVPFKNGVKFKIRSFGSRASRDVREELERPHQSEIARDVVDQKVMEDIAREQVCRAIIVDWSGVKDVDGELVPFSYDNVKALFSSDTMDGLLAEVIQVAIDQKTFNADLDNDAVKN